MVKVQTTLLESTAVFLTVIFYSPTYLADPSVVLEPCTDDMFSLTAIRIPPGGDIRPLMESLMHRCPQRAFSMTGVM